VPKTFSGVEESRTAVETEGGALSTRVLRAPRAHKRTDAHIIFPSPPPRVHALCAGVTRAARAPFPPNAVPAAASRMAAALRSAALAALLAAAAAATSAPLSVTWSIPSDARIP
jgi:hypothetical protein